ncbi:hypothetical protein V6N12_009506 [Hibiscus sabdariffa]|uniref:Uncharacterized protein n=1 Tax=Hibiscus sabdariffa TaxID=183260 RepID=A0ABR2E9B8_9ROSI
MNNKASNGFSLELSSLLMGRRLRFWVFGLELHQYSSHLLQSTAASLCFILLMCSLACLGDAWAGGSATVGGFGVGSGEWSSRMILAAGAFRFLTLEDSATSTGGACGAAGTGGAGGGSYGVF